MRDKFRGRRISHSRFGSVHGGFVKRAILSVRLPSGRYQITNRAECKVYNDTRERRRAHRELDHGDVNESSVFTFVIPLRG